jgi:hypothetical protein
LPQVILNIPDDIYRAIVDRASKEGYKDLSEYLLQLVIAVISSREPDLSKYIESIVAKYASRSERKLSDILNAYTSKIEELGSKVASLHEEIEDLKARIQGIEERERERERIAERESSKREERPQAKKATAIEILKQQKVFYESSIYGKIRNRDKFFQKLEKEGAVIINTDKERIAVDKEFWESFNTKLARIREDSEEAIKSILTDRKEQELFEKLKESAILIFDATEKRWKLSL